MSVQKTQWYSLPPDIPYLFELFSLHLYGSAQDFVEILMVFWPRFEAYASVCVCVCARVLLLPVEGSWWCGGWLLSGSVVLARISGSLCEAVSHLLKEIMKSQKATLPINVHIAAILNSSVFVVCDYLPRIYTFMRRVPLRIFICEKVLLLYNQKPEKSNRQKS